MDGLSISSTELNRSVHLKAVLTVKWMKWLKAKAADNAPATFYLMQRGVLGRLTGLLLVFQTVFLPDISILLEPDITKLLLQGTYQGTYQHLRSAHNFTTLVFERAQVVKVGGQSRRSKQAVKAGGQCCQRMLKGRC